jgi:hypothetical protein
MWHTDPLLSGGSVNNDRFWAKLGKHVPMAMNTQSAIELLLETGCFYVVLAEML